MKKKIVLIMLIFLIAMFASISSFIVHVITVEKVLIWVNSQMEGLIVKPSWNVRYIAMITSIEYGIAASFLYYFGRSKLIKLGLLKATIIYGVLLAGVHGSFIRQPLMDIVIGNPFKVVLVQDGLQWITWLLMSFIIVYGIEFIFKIYERYSRVLSQSEDNIA